MTVHILPNGRMLAVTCCNSDCPCPNATWMDTVTWSDMGCTKFMSLFCVCVRCCQMVSEALNVCLSTMSHVSLTYVLRAICKSTADICKRLKTLKGKL